MIRRIEIIFRDTSVWAKGSAYGATPLVPFKDGEIVFQRDYDRGTPIDLVWKEIRDSMKNYFFLIFYPAVVWQTRRSEPVTDNSAEALAGQSGYIRRRQSELPEYYSWNSRLKKWTMTLEGYVDKVIEKDVTIGVSDVPYGYPNGVNWLEAMEDRHKGETMRLILFIYPDRYDEEIRAMFEMKVTFWD